MDREARERWCLHRGHGNLASGVRASASQAPRCPGRAGATSCRQSIPLRRRAGRKRLAIVPDAGALRRRVCALVQVHAADRRHAEPLEIHARAVPASGHRSDRAPQRDPAALLPLFSPAESARHRAAAAAAGFRRLLKLEQEPGRFVRFLSDEESTMTDETQLTAKLWKALKSDMTVMLGLTGIDEGHSQPMTAQLDDESERGGPIWFFTAKDTDLVKAMGERHRALLHFAAKGHEVFAS